MDFFAGTQFVFGNTITSFDVELMPKLHQLRIACSLVRSLNIPPNFTGVWRYLFRAYHCPAFVQWAPSDQEIVIAWTTKAASETPSMKLSFDEKKRLIKSEPCFSFSMPTQELTWKFSSTMIQDCEGASFWKMYIRSVSFYLVSTMLVFFVNLQLRSGLLLFSAEEFAIVFSTKQETVLNFNLQLLNLWTFIITRTHRLVITSITVHLVQQSSVFIQLY